jgi:hypothetical protein
VNSFFFFTDIVDPEAQQLRTTQEQPSQNMRIIVTASAIAWMGGEEAKTEASQKMIDIIKYVSLYTLRSCSPVLIFPVILISFYRKDLGVLLKAGEPMIPNRGSDCWVQLEGDDAGKVFALRKAPGRPKGFLCAIPDEDWPPGFWELECSVPSSPDIRCETLYDRLKTSTVLIGSS